jgi:hypothetical protein
MQDQPLSKGGNHGIFPMHILVTLETRARNPECVPTLTTSQCRQLKKESGIAYDDMLFFDDCNWGDNCGDVERGCPGVVTCKTPSGMSVQNWNDGLAKFAKAKAAARK